MTPTQLARARAWMPRRVPGPKLVYAIGHWLFSAESRDAFAVTAGRDVCGICPYVFLSLGPYLLLLIDRRPMERYDS